MLQENDAGFANTLAYDLSAFWYWPPGASASVRQATRVKLQEEDGFVNLVPCQFQFHSS